MVKKLIKKYGNLSLFAKFSFIIWGLALLITIAILLTSIIYYCSMAAEKLLDNAVSATRAAVNTVDINYTDILKRFVESCGTEEFASDLTTLQQPTISYAVKQSLIQNELSDLAGCNYLIHSAVMIDADGETYYTLYKNLMHSSGESFITKQELFSIEGITWLTERKSPFRNTVNIIPIIFPVYVNSDSFTQIARTKEQADSYLVLMLESSKLSYSLSNSGAYNSNGTYFLLTSQGQFLNPSSSSQLPSLPEEPDVLLLIQTLTNNRQKSNLYHGSGYYLLASRLDKSGLILMNYVERETFVSVFGRSGFSILIILLVIIITLIIVSFLLTRYITKPLHILVNVVNQISENSYEKHIHFSTNDEVGTLCSAINSMHNTIQQQMECIKQEEEAKYMTEIKLLAEQINPHFLYNTLECAQLEVLNGHSQAASNMIQYLAEYLRIGLSYGDNLITISNELRHVHAYIKIMNQRFGQSILFMYQVEPGLDRHKILKTILQPLVENSIKHGFSIDSTGIPISSPTIEINFSSIEDKLNIEISDNGGGFDEEKTQSILYGQEIDSEQNRHVGLKNIYHRLVTYYRKGNVAFTLSSIPYYRNTIQIQLPLTARKEQNDKTTV